MSTNVQTLPREIAPGLTWLGSCYEMPYRDEIFHSGDSTFLVRGEHSSLLVEAGLPQDFDLIYQQLEEELKAGPPLRYIWATHQETPHAGGVGCLLEQYPEAELVGDIHDYHLFFPQYAHRMHQVDIGESIDLGGRKFKIVDAVIRDLITSQWAVDEKTGALFTGDGFAYAHLHRADQCGMYAEEVPELDIEDMTDLFAEHSLNWARFTNTESHIQQLKDMLERENVKIIAPTHGLVICDPGKIAPQVLAGLRAAGFQSKNKVEVGSSGL